MYYTIDNDNDITAHDSAPEAQDGTILFATEKQFAKAAAEWPISRFVEVWNSFAGVAGPFGDLKPVKKFENRAKATARIWTAIQVLGTQVEKAAAATPAPEAEVEPKATPVATDATDATDAPPAPAPAKRRAAKKDATPAPRKAKRAAKAEATGWTPREGSQSAKVIALLKRKNGATMSELMAATGWLKHSVRGFISTLPKKSGLAVTSARRESDKARVYAAQ